MNWICETMANGGFWRDIIATLVGVFCGAIAAWLTERHAALKKERQHFDAVRGALVSGLSRNLISLRHITNLVGKGKVVPSLRLDESHFRVAVLEAAAALEAAPEDYEKLMCLADAVAQINRRLDQITLIQVLCRNDATHSADPYLEEMRRLVTPPETWLRELLAALGATSNLEEIDRVTLSKSSP